MLISQIDQNLLAQHQVTIEVNTSDGSGVIIFKERQFKVTLLTRPSGNNNAPWKTKTLEEEAMKDTASKVAVMLLKKELLQGQQAQPLELQINASGFTNLSDSSLIAPHQAQEVQKDTRNDYGALMGYLADIDDEELIDEQEDKDTEEVEEDIQLNIQEITPLIRPEKVKKKKKVQGEEVKKLEKKSLTEESHAIIVNSKKEFIVNANTINEIYRSPFPKNDSFNDLQIRIETLPVHPHFSVRTNFSELIKMMNFIKQNPDLSTFAQPLELPSTANQWEGPRIEELTEEELIEEEKELTKEKNAKKFENLAIVVSKPNKVVSSEKVDPIPRLFLPKNPPSDESKGVLIKFNDDLLDERFFSITHSEQSLLNANFFKENINSFYPDLEQQNPPALTMLEKEISEKLGEHVITSEPSSGYEFHNPNKKLKQTANLVPQRKSNSNSIIPTLQDLLKTDQIKSNE